MVNNFGRREAQLMPPNDKGHESPFDLNLTQLAKHKELIEKRTCF
jgi:hypothetical protein